MTDALHVGANGLEFRVLRHGAGEPLVLLHGFTGRAESWLPVFDELAAAYELFAIDLTGHGESAAPTDHGRYGYDQAIADLASVVDQLEVGRAIWLGYSLGGRLALGVAVAHPERVAALVLESATAGIEDVSARAMRCASDGALADRIEAHGIEAFVAEWESLPMWASQQSLGVEALAAQRAQRLANSPVGLANSLRGMGQAVQPPLWDRLGSIQAPTLLIAGALDPKFAEIAGRMAQAIPSAELALVPSAGHAVHLEGPDRFVATVREFLGRRPAAALPSPEEVIQ